MKQHSHIVVSLLFLERVHVRVGSRTPSIDLAKNTTSSASYFRYHLSLSVVSVASPFFKDPFVQDQWAKTVNYGPFGRRKRPTNMGSMKTFCAWAKTIFKPQTTTFSLFVSSVMTSSNQFQEMSRRTSHWKSPSWEASPGCPGRHIHFPVF